MNITVHFTLYTYVKLWSLFDVAVHVSVNILSPAESVLNRQLSPGDDVDDVSGEAWRWFKHIFPQFGATDG